MIKLEALEDIKNRNSSLNGMVYTGDIDWLISEIERLEKENEWLLEQAAFDVYTFIAPTMKEKKEIILKEMQQEFKEKK